MAEEREIGAIGAPLPPPRTAVESSQTSGVTDEKLQALDALCFAITERIGAGLTLVRDNPGRTPPAWSVAGEGDRKVLTFGLVDRTFYWTWDDGVSNHYSKDAATMSAVILEELRRFGHLA